MRLITGIFGWIVRVVVTLGVVIGVLMFIGKDASITSSPGEWWTNASATIDGGLHWIRQTGREVLGR